MTGTVTLGSLAQISRTVRDIEESEEWMAHFRDPEGRPLAIMSQVKP
jgi:hypothetical protein